MSGGRVWIFFRRSSNTVNGSVFGEIPRSCHGAMFPRPRRISACALCSPLIVSARASGLTSLTWARCCHARNFSKDRPVCRSKFLKLTTALRAASARAAKPTFMPATAERTGIASIAIRESALSTSASLTSPLMSKPSSAKNSAIFIGFPCLFLSWFPRSQPGI